MFSLWKGIQKEKGKVWKGRWDGWMRDLIDNVNNKVKYFRFWYWRMIKILIFFIKAILIADTSGTSRKIFYLADFPLLSSTIRIWDLLFCLFPALTVNALCQSMAHQIPLHHHQWTFFETVFEHFFYFHSTLTIILFDQPTFDHFSE